MIKLQKRRIYLIKLKIGYIESVKQEKQTIYNYSNICKLLNCRVNMTYFIKNHEILLVYFKKKMKNRYLGNITFVVHVRLVSATFPKNQGIRYTAKLVH